MQKSKDISIFQVAICMLLGIFGAVSCNAAPAPNPGVDDAQVVAMTQEIYKACGGKLGPLAQADILRTVSDVALGYFEKPSDQLSFIILVCIESRFDPSAKSGAGAVGLTQILPRYAGEFAGRCYLSTIPVDLYVPRANLSTGACQWRHLLEYYGGNYALALAAYNSGKDSPTVRKMRRLERINTESADYISRFYYLYSTHSSLLAPPVATLGGN